MDRCVYVPFDLHTTTNTPILDGTFRQTFGQRNSQSIKTLLLDTHTQTRARVQHHQATSFTQKNINMVQPRMAIEWKRDAPHSDTTPHHTTPALPPPPPRPSYLLYSVHTIH